MFFDLKVGIALGGGAARGLAHLGVLKTLEKHGIPVHFIAGTSIGAVIGAMYAIDPNAEQITKRFVDYLSSEDFRGAKMDFMSHARKETRGFVGTMFDKILGGLRRSVFYGVSLTNISYLSQDLLARNLEYLVPDLFFKHCMIPFSCCTTDLREGRYFYFDEGSLQQAVLASCSIPGIFPPVEYKGRLLIDGSWSDQNPVRRVREMGADIVIAVHIVHDEEIITNVRNSLDVLIAGNQVTKRTLAALQLDDADIVIAPDTKNVHWADFSKSNLCIKQGIVDTEAQMENIKAALSKSKRKKYITNRIRRLFK